MTIINNGKQMDIKPTRTATVLGVKWDKTGSTQTAYDHRKKAAMKAFYRDIKFYTCKAVNITDKLKKYDSEVRSTLLHGAGGWVWNETLRGNFRRATAYSR